MNPVVVYFLDGTAFLAGLAVVIVALACLLLAKNKWVRGSLTAAMLAAVVVVLASGVPLSVWTYVLWVGLCVLALYVGGGAWEPKVETGQAQEEGAPTSKKYQSVGDRWSKLGPLAALLWLTLCVAHVEWMARLEPRITVEKGRTVYVIGDSISAGSGKEKTWPAMLGDKTGLKVVNLAQAGATTQMAQKQALGVKSDAGLVIVEIGGNDVLGTTGVDAFETELDTLVGSLTSKGFRVMVLDLPCVPFKNGFGLAMRRVVSKHGAALAPRNLLVNAMAIPGGTTDGLHLSEKGHEVMAQGFERIVLNGGRD